MSSPVPLRLQVVNAFISLCRADDAWPSTLHDAGYHLAGLEIPVRGEAGVIVIDAVAQHTDRDALLAAECKSGANVHAEQARRLSELDAAALLRMVAAPAVGGAAPSVEAVFVCAGEHLSRILQGLAACKVAAPVIAVSDQAISGHGPAFADEFLNAAFSDAVPVTAPPPAYLTLDSESADEDVDEHVLAELVACMAQGVDDLTVPALAERVVQLYTRLGDGRKGVLRRKIDASARRLASRQPEQFAYRPSTGARRDPTIGILKSPEQHDPRGRTQAYQALARAATAPRSRHRPRPEVEGQLDLLLHELNAGVDPSEEEVE